MVDFSSLADLPKQTRGWTPLTPEDLAGPDLDLLLYDQSFQATGMVLLSRRDRGLMVKVAHTIKTQSDKTSFEEDFDRALQVEDAVEYDTYKYVDLSSPTFIVHETPPVPSARLMKVGGPRAGIPARMAGQAIRSVAKRRGIEVLMVNSQRAKTLVCGNHKADKSEAHAALKRDVFPWLRGHELVTNEAKRDALLLGLVVMKERAGDRAN